MPEGFPSSRWGEKKPSEMFTNSAGVAAATGSDQPPGLEVGRGAIKPSEIFPASISAAGL